MIQEDVVPTPTHAPQASDGSDTVHFPDRYILDFTNSKYTMLHVADCIVAKMPTPTPTQAPQINDSSDTVHFSYR
jgi:hypothetical protein